LLQRALRTGGGGRDRRRDRPRGPRFRDLPDRDPGRGDRRGLPVVPGERRHPRTPRGRECRAPAPRCGKPATQFGPGTDGAPGVTPQTRLMDKLCDLTVAIGNVEECPRGWCAFWERGDGVAEGR